MRPPVENHSLPLGGFIIHRSHTPFRLRRSSPRGDPRPSKAAIHVPPRPLRRALLHTHALAPALRPFTRSASRLVLASPHTTSLQLGPPQPSDPGLWPLPRPYCTTSHAMFAHIRVRSPGGLTAWPGDLALNPNPGPAQSTRVSNSTGRCTHPNTRCSSTSR